MALKCIQAQLEQLQRFSIEDPFINIQGGPIDDKDLFIWQGYIFGHKNSPYEDGMFQLQINFSKNYPFKPPKVKFITPIYHPNIDKDGNIQIDILYNNNWSPTITITQILLCISALLKDPDPDRFVPTIRESYQNEKYHYQTTEREWTQKFAK
ncbi:unnamed protein product [Paramecium pentaurelia]|uniref:UBC core domain-containing protein n=1 Tax=Paramecium pentaurelia TaxID=43138 RepID=A0A8S1VFR3_9CILI|nr:unnamed protein product [Paramecium pentaurelia]